MKKRVSIATALAALLALIVGVIISAPAATAAPAASSLTSVVAGSSLKDFYQTTSSTSSGGKMFVENYDIASGADQRYEHTVTPYSGWKIVGLYVDGYKWPYGQSWIKAWSGNSAHGYTDDTYTTRDHTWRVVFERISDGYRVGTSTKTL
jgi:hypothetical protein